MTPLESLQLAEENYYSASAEYANACEKFQELEEKYKIIRANIMNMDRVMNLNNQAMRDAEADLILQNDDRYEPLYRQYLEAKLKQKKAWIMYDVRKEMNENARAMLNNFTFSKEVRR